MQPQAEQTQMSINEMEPGGKSFCRRRGLNHALSQDRTGPSKPARVVPERVSTVVIVRRGRDEINSQANQIVI
jgi:hypothetical protein